MSNREEQKEEMHRQNENAFGAAPARSIDFQNDTISVYTGCAAYFNNDKNALTVNVHEHAPITQSKAVKAHEQKHRDNHRAGIEELNMSVEQHYKKNCLNEISAQICGLLQAREEYLTASTPEERQIIEKRYSCLFPYYFKAIKDKQIDPFSANPQGFENEMKFIAQETQKYWMENSLESYELYQLPAQTLDTFEKHSYEELAPNEENYQKARRIMLSENTGGIDFTKYLDDIECKNPNIKKADELIAKNRPRSTIRTKIKYSNFDIAYKMTDLFPTAAEYTLKTALLVKKAASKTKNFFTNLFPTSKKNSAAETENNIYKGEPIYDTTWSPERRVSGVMHEDICDFTKPFLRERYEKMLKLTQDRQQTSTALKAQAHIADNSIKRAQTVPDTPKVSSKKQEERPLFPQLERE